MKKLVTPFVEYLTESTTACLVTMVQGNLLALTASHLLIASETGIFAGVLTAITLGVTKTDRRWIISVVLGITTAIVDYLVHPGMFGAVAVEAIVTGLGAALLSYLAGTAMRYFKQKNTATN